MITSCWWFSWTSVAVGLASQIKTGARRKMRRRNGVKEKEKKGREKSDGQDSLYGYVKRSVLLVGLAFVRELAKNFLCVVKFTV